MIRLSTDADRGLRSLCRVSKVRDHDPVLVATCDSSCMREILSDVVDRATVAYVTERPGHIRSAAMQSIRRLLGKFEAARARSIVTWLATCSGYPPCTPIS